MTPDRETSIDAKIARVDQHLSDFEGETIRRLEGLEEAIKGANARVLGFALTVATSCMGLALTVLFASGKL